MSKPIPIAAAKRIADDYGYDQVIVYGRNWVTQNNEHITTYGKTKALCLAAGRISATFQKWMGWFDVEGKTSKLADDIMPLRVALNTKMSLADPEEVHGYQVLLDNIETALRK